MQGQRLERELLDRREWTSSFATSDPSDPDLAAAFRSAVAAGVEAYAYNCEVTERLIRLDQALPIRDYAETVSNV